MILFHLLYKNSHCCHTKKERKGAGMLVLQVEDPRSKFLEGC